MPEARSVPSRTVRFNGPDAARSPTRAQLLRSTLCRAAQQLLERLGNASLRRCLMTPPGGTRIDFAIDTCDDERETRARAGGRMGSPARGILRYRCVDTTPTGVAGCGIASRNFDVLIRHLQVLHLLDAPKLHMPAQASLHRHRERQPRGAIHDRWRKLMSSELREQSRDEHRGDHDTQQRAH